LADTIRLKPEPIHYRKAQLVATLLQQMHYNQAKLDDRISEEALKLYLQSLDNNKLYFLASDIASFSKYTHSLDNQLAMGEIAPAFEIYAVYQNRLLARINKILNETLLTTHDYTLDETYLYDRSYPSRARRRVAQGHQKPSAQPTSNRQEPRGNCRNAARTL
jgi:carboxyl-terminal processing protease